MVIFFQRIPDSSRKLGARLGRYQGGWKDDRRHGVGILTEHVS